MPLSRNQSPPEVDEKSNLIPLIIKWGAVAVIVIILLVAFFGSWFTVEQNEVAAVTRMGSLISKEPVPAGFHFKMPFADTVHHIRTSMDRLDIGRIEFKTQDNQFGSVEVNLTYRTGDPFKAMFKVGELGSKGIIDKVTPFVKNRTLDVFGKVNASNITDTLTELQKSILLAIQEPAMDYFGMRIEDVQLTGLKYSDVFEKNVEMVVQTRNLQTQATNLLEVKKKEADQAVAFAKGQADAAAATADGNKRAAIASAEGAAQQVRLQAQAAADQVRLQADAAAYARKVQSETEAGAIHVIGEAQGFQLAQMVKAAGSADLYNAYIRSQASMKWDGSVPKITLGSGEKGTQSLFVLPSDAVK